MMTSRSGDAAQEKKDLHVGGLGGSAPVVLVTKRPAADEEGRVSVALLSRARAAARDADDYVHDHPWVAMGLVGFVGWAAGYFWSRRS